MESKSDHQQSGITSLHELDDEVETSMQKKLELSFVSSDKCCIYNVPDFIRKGNEKHYKPSVISIGPIYYKDPTLETMQNLKWIYLSHFLQHSHNVNRNLKDYIKYVRDREGEIHECYQEHKISDKNEFIEMIVLDAAFLVYLFIQNNRWIRSTKPVAKKQRGLMFYLSKDIFLVENQLPFFVLQGFFDLAFGYACLPCTFIDIILDKMSRWNSYPGYNEASRKITDSSTIKHLLDLLRMRFCIPSNRDQLNFTEEDYYPNYTARQLSDAGVEFVLIESERPLQITFEKGKLMIPGLLLEDRTEPYLRSIIFFEQCHYTEDTYIIDYICFLDKLIDTVEDVQVLQQKKILLNLLGSDEDATRFFNNVTKNVNLECNFYYSGISRELNAFASTRWNQWKAVLRRKYFSHPWAAISVIAAIILFILTLLQTITGFTK